MRTCLLALLPGFLIGTVQPCGAGVLPEMDFFISVDTNDWLERPRGKTGLNVSLRFSSANQPGGEEESAINVSCYEFPDDCRELGQPEMNLFHTVCEEAGKKQAKRERWMSKGFRGEVETIFESTEEKGEWVAKVTRRGATAVFDPAESARLKAALAEAKAGAAWFKLLRKADKLPEKTAQAHPPKSDGYYLSSSVGTVDGGEMDYEVSLRAMSHGGKTTYHTENTLTIGGSTTSGGWVDKALDKISEAAAAAKAGKDFTYESPDDEHKGEDTFYTITANLQTGKGDVLLVPGKFFKSNKVWKGSYGVDEVKQIQKLKADAKVRQKWFEENESLFFKRPPAEEK